MLGVAWKELRLPSGRGPVDLVECRLACRARTFVRLVVVVVAAVVAVVDLRVF